MRINRANPHLSVDLDAKNFVVQMPSLSPMSEKQMLDTFLPPEPPLPIEMRDGSALPPGVPSRWPRKYWFRPEHYPEVRKLHVKLIDFGEGITPNMVDNHSVRLLNLLLSIYGH